MFEELKVALTARGVDFEVVVGVFRDPTLSVFSRSGAQTTVQIMGDTVWIWDAGEFKSVSAAAWALAAIAAIC
jgi:hypothetical protein